MTTELTIAFRPDGDLGDQVLFRADSEGKIWVATGLTTGRYLTAAEQAALFCLLQEHTSSVSLKELESRFSLDKRQVLQLELAGILQRTAVSYTASSVKAYETARHAVLALLDLETKFDLVSGQDFDRMAKYIDQAMSNIRLCSAKAYDATIRFAERIAPSAQAEAPATATTNVAEVVCVLVEMLQLGPVLTKQQCDTLSEYEDWVLYG
jgi:hypothetical protein